MASLVLGVAGAVIGSSFGMPSLGFSIGSALGSALDPAKTPTQYGPRLTDLKVVSSNYGEMIPIVYGTVRLAGKMIWSTPRIEHRHKKKVGGKGGPTQKVVTYTYTQSIAYALCDGEIDGITRIWINGELKYNASATASVSSMLASFQNSDGIQIYFGDETQTPNSIIQSYEGVASTPAYRGTAYVVFDNLDVSNLGNAFNVEFEVVKNGTYADYDSVMASVPLQPTIQFNKVATYIPSPNKVRVIAGDWDASYGSSNVWIYDLYPDGSSIRVSQSAYALPVSGQRGLAYGNSNKTATIIITANNSQKGYLLVYDPTAAFTPGTDPWFQTAFYLDSTFSSNSTASLETTFYLDDGLLLVGILGANNGTNFIYATNPGSPALATKVIDVSGTGHALNSIDCSDSYIYVSYYNGSNILVDKYNKTTYAYISNLITIAKASALLKVISDNEIYLFTDDKHIYEVSTGSAILKFTTVDNPTSPISTSKAAFSVFDQISITYSVYSSAKSAIFHTRPLTSSAVLLSNVVSDLCTKTGPTASDINVTQLTDSVYGYAIANVGSARSAIEPLMSCYYFDATEIDSKVVFVKRGQASIVTIPEDDLAAHEYGAEMPDQIYATRQQEMELPLQVNVTYLDKDNAYQVGSQYSRRLTTSSKQMVDIQLPLAISATKGKEVSDVLMYDAWAQREKIKLAVGNKYSYLTPTDVITTSKGNINYTLRLTNKNESNGIINFDAVAENITVYTQTQTAATMPTVEDTVNLNGDTKCLLLDLPLLRDQDDGVGFYAAACGYDTSWDGADLLKSSDNSTFSTYGDGFFNPATIGFANGVLGNWTGSNIFDETNTVSVTIYDGSLSSDTEINVLNGANVLLIGSEIIQFKNAALTASLTYTLSGLLRGRLGTDWAQSTHASGERVVILNSSSIYLLTAPSSEYNVARYYKAVTFGQNIIDADPFAFTNTAISKKPLSPVQLGYGVDASGNITIQWVRRTRIGGSWIDYTDASLGETTESYSIDILNGSTVVRTLTATTTSVTYSSANIATDSLTGQPFTANVYQVGANGRGYVGVLSVPSFNPTLNNANVISLLHLNGTNGSTTFTDAVGFASWSATGNAQLSTARQKFGTASLLLDGTGDYIGSANNTHFNFGSSDFTIEMFVYINANSALDSSSNRTAALFTCYPTSATNGYDFSIRGNSSTTGTGLALANIVSGVETDVLLTSTISQGAWHHLAVSKAGSRVYFGIDGVVTQGSGSINSPVNTGGNALKIGALENSTFPHELNGNIDEIRITNGQALYVANYTVPTAEFVYP